jgi:hypothetical protein
MGRGASQPLLSAAALALFAVLAAVLSMVVLVSVVFPASGVSCQTPDSGGLAVSTVNVPAGLSAMARELWDRPLAMQPGRWYPVGATEYDGVSGGHYGSIPNPAQSNLDQHPDSFAELSLDPVNPANTPRGFTFQDAKALAAGDTLILEQATLSAEVTRLQRLQRAYRNNQAALKRTVENHSAWLGTLDKEITALDAAIARQVDTRGDKFAITVDGTVHTNRADAGIALVHLLNAADKTMRPFGELGGLVITGCVRYSIVDEVREAQLGFDGLPGNLAHTTLPEARKDPLKVIRQLESRANNLDTLRAKTIASRASTEAETERARSAIGVPFKHADALSEATEKLEAVNAELSAKALEQERPAPVEGEDEPATDTVAVAVGASASDDIPI